MHTTPEASVITTTVMCATTKWNVLKRLDRTILFGRQNRKRWNCSICLCSNTLLMNWAVLHLKWRITDMMTSRSIFNANGQREHRRGSMQTCWTS